MKTKTIYRPGHRRLVARLSMERERRGLTQTDVARRMGVGRTWVGKVETFDLRLDLLQTVRLCTIYRVRCERVLKMLEEPSDEDGSSLPVAAFLRRIQAA